MQILANSFGIEMISKKFFGEKFFTKFFWENGWRNGDLQKKKVFIPISPLFMDISAGNLSKSPISWLFMTSYIFFSKNLTIFEKSLLASLIRNSNIQLCKTEAWLGKLKLVLYCRSGKVKRSLVFYLYRGR